MVHCQLWDGLVNDLDLLACLFEVPLLELFDKVFIDIVGPVVHLEDMAAVFR